MLALLSPKSSEFAWATRSLSVLRAPTQVARALSSAVLFGSGS
jgi:hypothetical protein